MKFIEISRDDVENKSIEQIKKEVRDKLKVRKFVNDIGCSMEFESGISDEQINMRLSILGKNWREVK